MNNSHAIAIAALLAGSLLGQAQSAPFPQGELVLLYGQPISGASSAAPLNSLRSRAVGNDGTWATLAGNLAGFPQDQATNLLVKNGTVLLEEGVSRLDGRVVRVIEQPKVLDDGRVLTLCGVGSLSFVDDVIALDDEVVLSEGDSVVDGSGVVLGSLSTIREAHVTDDGRVIVHAFVNEVAGGSSLRVIARDLNMPGSLPFSLFGGGDVLLDGSTVLGVLGVDVTANGRVATLSHETTAAGVAQTVYRVDGVIVLQDGDPAPIAGDTFQVPSSSSASTGFAVSESGRLGLLATVDSLGFTTPIVVSGALLLAITGQAPVGSSGPAVLDVTGQCFDMTTSDQLVWVASDENQAYGVYLDTERLISPGMPVAGSTLLEAGGSCQSGVVGPLSTNAGFLVEIVELADGRRGLWLLQRSIGESLSCGTVAHSGGLTAVIEATGSDLAGGNPLTLVATDLPAQTFGIFITSRVFDANGMSVASGQLCFGGILGRIPGVLFSGTQGRFEGSVNTVQLPQAILTAAQPGDTWFFQAWFRDANPMSTANFSDTAAVTFR